MTLTLARGPGLSLWLGYCMSQQPWCIKPVLLRKYVGKIEDKVFFPPIYYVSMIANSSIQELPTLSSGNDVALRTRLQWQGVVLWRGNIDSRSGFTSVGRQLHKVNCITTAIVLEQGGSGWPSVNMRIHAVAGCGPTGAPQPCQLQLGHGRVIRKKAFKIN